MDSTQFDTLVKSLSGTDTRRDLLRRLAPLPLAGLLATLLPDESAHGQGNGAGVGGGGGRRQRRKARHRHDPGDDKDNRKGKRKHKKKKPTCTPTTCAAQGKNCGSIADGCGTQIPCGPDDCGAGYSCTDNVCRCPDGTAVCQGVCCAVGQVCANGQCGCGAGTKPCDGRCIAEETCCGGCPETQVCANGQCGCGAGTKPCDGRCIPEDTCAGCCPANHVCQNATCCVEPTALQAALTAGPDTIRLCANTTYHGNFRINRSLTVIGAGMDSSILDGNLTGQVLRIAGGLQVTLQQLRVTRGSSASGAGIFMEPGNTVLTLQDAKVSSNTASSSGGGIRLNSGTTLAVQGSSVIENNTAGVSGGGIFNVSSTDAVTFTGTSCVRGNQPDQCANATCPVCPA